MGKGFDEAAAKEMIQYGLRSVAGEEVAEGSGAVIEAAFELIRQSSVTTGERPLSISSVEVGVGSNEEEDDSVTAVFQASKPIRSGPERRTPIGSGPEKRIPIRYGGTGCMCFLVSKGPPPVYFCITW